MSYVFTPWICDICGKPRGRHAKHDNCAVKRKLRQQHKTGGKPAKRLNKQSLLHMAGFARNDHLGVGE